MIALGLLIVAASSCVPIRKYEELQAKETECQEDLGKLRDDYAKMEGEFNEALRTIDALQKKAKALREDTTLMGNAYRRLTKSYEELNESYELLIANNNTLIARNAAENRKLLEQLEKTEQELLAKEEALTKEQERLNALNSRLKELETNLEKREERVNELESALSKKDSISSALRDKIAAALTRFEGKGLTVEQKNGKVYVSLENSLLFASGSWNVDASGKQAIQDLAGALSENPDLDILIEGHTDNDEYNGSGAIKDNWDLSVMRATSIVKILTQAGVDPTRLTAAGRGEFIPVASNETSAGKAANRRIEIIISPDLGVLYDVIQD